MVKIRKTPGGPALKNPPQAPETAEPPGPTVNLFVDVWTPEEREPARRAAASVDDTEPGPTVNPVPEPAPDLPFDFDDLRPAPPPDDGEPAEPPVPDES